MNWYKRAASIVQVSPTYRGKDSGTAGARPFMISDNERIFGNENNTNITAFPENWDQLSIADRAKYIIPQVAAGRIRFPYQIEEFAKQLFQYKPSLFFHAIFTCLRDTGKLPNFTRNWMEINYKQKSLPKELDYLVEKELQKFQPNRRILHMLYEDYPARSVNINRK